MCSISCARAGPDPDAALAAHPRLAAALTTFMAGPERRVIVLPGTRDAQLAYDQRLADIIESNGWEIALACLLEIDTGCGVSVVRVEPGHRLDPSAAFTNPRDPNDHPLAQHLERDVLPTIAAAGRAGTSSWLAGVEDAEPAEMGTLVASRFAYRRLFRRAAWLTLPVLALLALFFPVVVFTSRRIDSVAHVFRILAAGFAIELALVVVALVFVIIQLRDALGSVVWLGADTRGNDEARGEAVAIAAAGGAGLVTAHTRRAELTDLGNGAFYANCGSAGRVVERVASRGGLPPVYAARLRCSWIELEAGAELHARLWHGVRDLPERTLLERLAMRSRLRASWPPVEVAEHPGTVTWPSAGDATAHRRRTRRIAATAIAFVGVLNIVSAVTLPLAVASAGAESTSRRSKSRNSRRRSRSVGRCGLAVPRVRECAEDSGTRGCWRTPCYSLSVAGNVFKGLDIEEAVLALLLLGFLWVHRDDFTAPANPSSARRAVGAALIGIMVVLIGGTIGVALAHPDLSIEPDRAGGFRAAGGSSDAEVARPTRRHRCAGAARRDGRDRRSGWVGCCSAPRWRLA